MFICNANLLSTLYSTVLWVIPQIFDLPVALLRVGKEVPVQTQSESKQEESTRTVH